MRVKFVKLPIYAMKQASWRHGGRDVRIVELTHRTEVSGPSTRGYPVWNPSVKCVGCLVDPRTGRRLPLFHLLDIGPLLMTGLSRVSVNLLL
jgi:hypothetical protein